MGQSAGGVYHVCNREVLMGTMCGGKVARAEDDDGEPANAGIEPRIAGDIPAKDLALQSRVARGRMYSIVGSGWS